MATPLWGSLVVGMAVATAATAEATAVVGDGGQPDPALTPRQQRALEVHVSLPHGQGAEALMSAVQNGDCFSDSLRRQCGEECSSLLLTAEASAEQVGNYVTPTRCSSFQLLTPSVAHASYY